MPLPGLPATALSCLCSLLMATAVGAQGDAGSRISAVRIIREEVFDSTESGFWPWRMANTLHVETRDWVVRRELLFAEGDLFDSVLVAESERNLRALGVFREVSIAHQRTDSGVSVVVRTADAWSTTMGIGISASESQSVVDLSVQESNLLGTRTRAVVSWRNDPDRSSIATLVESPRVIGNLAGMGMSFVDRSDGRSGSVSLRLPFLSLSSRIGGSLVGSWGEGRVLRFAGGQPAPVDSLWREQALLHFDIAIAPMASPRGYLRVGLQVQLWRDDVVPLLERQSLQVRPRLAAGPYVALRRPRYIRTRNVTLMDRTEDIDIGPFGNVGILLAPGTRDHEAGVGARSAAGFGALLPGGFARARMEASVLRTRAGTDSASLEAMVSWVAQPGPRHLVILHASGGMLRHPMPGREFDLGLGTGLRSYPGHAFTGDRQYILAAEYRLLIWQRLFGVAGVGLAAFAGEAGAWYDGSPARSGAEAGVGLRIASVREVGGIWRLDLSRRRATDRLASGWVLSLGRGFVFGGI